MNITAFASNDASHLPFSPTVARFGLLLVVICGGAAGRCAGQSVVSSADRTIAVTIGPSGRTQQTPTSNVVASACPADPSQNRQAWTVDGWASYERLWIELAANPADPVLRKYLGLPIGDAANDSVVIKSNRGRSAPKWLGWKSGSYRQVETPHLQIFSHADDQTTHEVAADMERVFWVWTQLFYPLWEARPQIALHLRGADDRHTIASTLAKTRARLTTRRKLRIVLLRDAADYARTLGQSMPGIEQSTGFYSDERQTSFFYPSESSDAVATRRHELVHQLFREATRSGLGGESPGRDSDFWLVEGIAGYFESLQFVDNRATVGGWDSPRLQFARYRVFGRREIMPLSELQADGQTRAQRRSDLAGWYAFAIAYTHQLLDGNDVGGRRWVYQQLAELYRVNMQVPGARTPAETELQLIGALRVDDDIVRTNPTSRDWSELCLSGCQVTGQGLQAIEPTNLARWIDLTSLPVSSADLKRLVPMPAALEQLSLEATGVDDSLADWIGNAKRLSELDLSQTRCGDQTVRALAGHNRLRTLWLTGSAITDASIAILTRLPAIESIDVQRTQITPRGLATLKIAHPNWKINPL